MNKVILLGRMVKDAELKYTPSNVAVASFTVAVDRKFAKQGEEKQADFINVVAWRNTAEFVSKYFTKGQMIALCGSIQVRNWEDSEGNKHYVTEVIADEVYFAGKKEADATPKAAAKPSANLQALAQNDFVEVEQDDDLPF